MSSESEGDGQLHWRRFLKVISGVGAALTGLAVGVPTLTAFVSPALRKPSAMSWIKVADDVSTLDVGTPIKVDFVEAHERRLGREPRPAHGVAVYRGRREVHCV